MIREFGAENSLAKLNHHYLRENSQPAVKGYYEFSQKHTLKFIWWWLKNVFSVFGRILVQGAAFALIIS